MLALLLWSFAFCFLLCSCHKWVYKTNKPTHPVVTMVSNMFSTFSCVVLCSCPPAQLLMQFGVAQHAGHTLNTPGKPGSEQQTEKPKTCFQSRAKKKAFGVLRMSWGRCGEEELSVVGRSSAGVGISFDMYFCCSSVVLNPFLWMRLMRFLGLQKEEMQFCEQAGVSQTPTAGPPLLCKF